MHVNFCASLLCRLLRWQLMRMLSRLPLTMWMAFNGWRF